MTEKTKYHVINLTPLPDQASKPRELIQVTGHQTLSLNARRAITLLWHNAHHQGIEENKDYTIDLSVLRSDAHKGTSPITEAILTLMQSIITIYHPDGSVRRVQFLGGNDMDHPDRPDGSLTYSFDKRLIEILKDSTIWGRISLPVLMALSSKYGISLYENMAQWSGLTHKVAHTFDLETFRQILGVEEGKYEAFGELNKHVIKPNVAEINALAPFNMSAVGIKTGRRVTHIRVRWWGKTTEELKEAWTEIHNTKVGRKARIAKKAELVFVAPKTS